jgi:hypothetical protein
LHQKLHNNNDNQDKKKKEEDESHKDSMGKHSNLTYYIPTQMIIYDKKKGICSFIHHYKIAHS